MSIAYDRYGDADDGSRSEHGQMKMYKLQMQTATTGLPWEYNFDMASDEMAVEYTKRVIKRDGALPAMCMSVNLWGMGDDMQAYFIVEMAVETQAVVTVMRQGPGADY